MTELWCNDNELGSLDVSKNAALKELDYRNNYITTLTLKGGLTATSPYIPSGSKVVSEIEREARYNWIIGKWYRKDGRSTEYYDFYNDNTVKFSVEWNQRTGGTNSVSWYKYKVEGNYVKIIIDGAGGSLVFKKVSSVKLIDSSSSGGDMIVLQKWL